ncbi:IS30 family transposase [Nocardioides taihuensis]|uniref:IS30 family transposase n=1 Tax=Nocardioides taihuensis TaxID=1835606 RepID=A0ABW0BE42_9ACTN
MERCTSPGGFRLSLADRQSIENGCRAGFGFTVIATVIGKSPSTVSREVGGRAGRACYRADLAQLRAEVRALRPKATKLEANPALCERVITGLEALLSPEQIAGGLRREFPEDPEMQVHHETIYRELFVQGRGALREELKKYLRSGRTRRVTRTEVRQRRNDGRGQIPDMVNIVEREEEVAERRVPGHWEGDLITGKNNASAIGTLVERVTGYTLLLHLPQGHGAEQVTAAITEAMTALPANLRKTLTWDQGKELSRHKQIAQITGLKVYFCDPHSPWQRATNENTNGLLRQYFPKGTDLSVHSKEDLAWVQDQFNDRPRKRLDYAAPSELINGLLLH